MQIVCFLDNDGARHSLIKAGGGDLLMGAVALRTQPS